MESLAKTNLHLPSPRRADPAWRAKLQARLDALAKPVGSLGSLEPVLCDIAAIQCTEHPRVRRPFFLLFAGDHGVAKDRPISRYGQHVTEEMVNHIASGRSVSTVLARSFDVPWRVYDVGMVSTPRHPDVRRRKVAAGTRDFTRGPAMTLEECTEAIRIGMEAVRDARADGADLVILGEMGIGNTTAASALSAWLLGVDVDLVVGTGTGIHEQALAEKRLVVRTALSVWREREPVFPAGDARWLAGLAHLGGLELAAICGAILEAAAFGLPVLLDGVLVGACALWAECARPGVRDVLIAGHLSPEPAHALLLGELRKRPLLDLGLRVGEGSGALMAWPVLRAGLDVLEGTAMFSERARSGRDAE
ncbi:nicotinate-nucleotide--dimethylbenzimidazole phosphoribosyltransferase [Alicyclobacillus sendaiensis]|uniref:Nicotinate-nucleotide--dimethylbenzimidazole phosphoribosyltransferase n=1 Tax=Alicyclobacillus sendaiensis PA2 TaxID=3029425 RepID=A0ABT6XW18_ALISE|nr:nicotinate-nucleotide--dimethylbenzimidazole phosphoribosyltransferase [Alicyclobacillus sendaiensis]MDI9259286.1 nicotinate-nucleotide--dimethylbenzimidazole phosphoribosyltransferase [Alicyclobacillus sendaiensis PA2]